MPTFKIPGMNSKSSNTRRKSRLSCEGGASSSTIPGPCPEPVRTGNSSAPNKSQSLENPTICVSKSVRARTGTRCFEPENFPEGEKGDDKQELKKAADFAHAARQNACPNPLWEEMETYFAPITPENLLLLNQTHPAEELSGIEKSLPTDPSLIQRALAALITEDEIEQWEGVQSEGIAEVNLEAQENIRMNGVSESQTSVPENEYQMLSLEDKLLLEFQSLDLNVEKPPRSEEKEGEIQLEIKELQEKLCQMGWMKKKKIEKIKKAIEQEQGVEKRTAEEAPFEKLIEIAYQKLIQPMLKKDRTSKKKKKGRTSKRKKKDCTSNGLCTQENLEFIERTLKRCKDFEETGRSCFSEINLQYLARSAPPRKTDKENVEINREVIGCSTPPSTSVSGTKRKRCIDKPPSGAASESILRPRKKKEKVNGDAVAVIINVEEEEGDGGEKAASGARRQTEQKIISTPAEKPEHPISRVQSVIQETTELPEQPISSSAGVDEAKEEDVSG